MASARGESPELGEGGLDEPISPGAWRPAQFMLSKMGALPPVEEDAPTAVAETPRLTWNVEASKTLYNTAGWGEPYFTINSAGNLAVRPTADAEREVDVYKLVQALHEQGLRTPVLLRFLDIVGDRITKLNGAFQTAIERFEYQGGYRGVFPVKCNHDKDLIRSIMAHGKPYGFGLEVGSKAELAMVMSILGGHPGANLICNGIKDCEYMELVLHCRQLGINAIVVMEQYYELDMLLEVSERLGVRPAIGIRAKLTTQHKGHWGSTSGDKAKFGLRTREIVAAVTRLEEADMLDCLQLLHFHSGSQITSIREVKEVMRESSYLYAELVQLGAGMKFIDVGGGLAVDYDGSFTDTPASMSYTIQNYANDVVGAMQEVCIQRGIAPPTIISESGRALASHHSVFVFDVLSKPHTIRESEKREEEAELISRVASSCLDDAAGSPAPNGGGAGGFANGGAAVSAFAGGGGACAPLTRQWHLASRLGKGQFLLTTFKEVFDAVEPDESSLREAFTDATYYKDEALRAFKLGILSLEERAQIETMHDATCEKIRQVAEQHALPLPDALRPTSIPGPKHMYHVNMSVFRSSVDVWGISQLFPVMPIHRLEEEPSVMATLADLTCDSDGKIDRFINTTGGDALPALALHELKLGEKYYIAMFMTGVYQEVMGSVHNMFGSVNTVVVRSLDSPALDGTPAGAQASSGGGAPLERGLKEQPSVLHSYSSSFVADGFMVEHVVRGETVGEVLRRAHHHAPEMLAAVKEAADASVASGALAPAAAAQLLDNYAARLSGYTYMDAPGCA